MSEELVVEQCSPTMAGLKTGNLFSCPAEDTRTLWQSIRRLNQRLVPCGIRLVPVKSLGDRELIYMYRPEKLRRDLREQGARAILREKRYPTEDPERCVVELVRRLKNHGYSVYYLSNIPEDVLALLKERGVLDRFDGGVASCEVHINKPDPRIYQALLDKYSLKASECVFIDDNLANVQAAFTLGFVGIRMKESVGTLIRSLATCNVALR